MATSIRTPRTITECQKDAADVLSSSMVNVTENPYIHNCVQTMFELRSKETIRDRTIKECDRFFSVVCGNPLP